MGARREQRLRLIPLALALALVVTVTACGGGSSAQQVPPPVSAPASSPEPEILAEDPAAEDPAAEQPVTARELTMEGVVDCVDAARGKALFIESYTREYAGPESRNIRALDLETGAETALPVWADNGLCQWNGSSYYWVAMDDTPVERTGTSFGPGAAEIRWQDYVQEGIRRGDGTGEGELIYTLPRRPGELTEDDITYPWRGEERQITALAAGERYLAWVETWATSNEELGDFYVYELWAMETEKGTPHRYCIGGSDTPDRHRLRMRGDRMLFIGAAQTGFPSHLYLYDLAGGGLELLDPPVIYDPQDMAFDEGRMVWGCRYSAASGGGGTGAVPTFTAFSLRSRETREVEVPRAPGLPESRERWEHIGGLGLFGGRYVLYSLWAGDQSGGGVRLWDQETGEVLYRSEEDSGLDHGGRAYDYNALTAEEGGDRAVLISGREGERTVVTVFRVKGEDAAPAPAESAPESTPTESAPASAPESAPAESAPVRTEEKPLHFAIRLNSDGGENPGTDAPEGSEPQPMEKLWGRSSRIRSYIQGSGLTTEDFGILYVEESGGRFTLTISAYDDEAVDRLLEDCPEGLIDEVVRSRAACSRARMERFEEGVRALPRQEGEYAVAVSQREEESIRMIFSPSAKERLMPEITRLLAEQGIPEELLTWELREDAAAVNPDT